MDVKLLWAIATEIFKTVNNLNPSYIKDLFSFQKPTRRRQKTD